MTRDEILALPAGRELDKLVAEKAMGWQRRGPGFFADDANVWVDVGTAEELGEKEDGFCPSRKIADAWRVVGWLRERWGSVALLAGLEWHCAADAEAMAGTWGSGPTPELAICRAALLAVEAAC